MKCAVAVFAKTIGLSPVKTRLAASLGTKKAEAFYSLSVSAVTETLGAVQASGQDIRPFWCVAEEDGPQQEQWSRFPAIWTGEGGLGERLANICERLFEDHDAVMLMGTDSPQLSPDYLLNAFRVVKENPDDCVAGPAADGGFCLFVSANPVAREIWEKATYSVDTTLAELTAHLLEQDMFVRLLETMQDVDTFDDLKTLKAFLELNKDSLPAGQKRILDWINSSL